MPLGVETVFPVVPLAYRVDRDSGKIGEGFISERFHIMNANNATVATTPFLNPQYAGVSALIGCAAERTYGKALDLHVVHNPRADVRLPLGSLGARDDEWFALPAEGAADEFELQKAHMPKVATSPTA